MPHMMKSNIRRDKESFKYQWSIGENKRNDNEDISDGKIEKELVGIIKSG